MVCELMHAAPLGLWFALPEGETGIPEGVRHDVAAHMLEVFGPGSAEAEERDRAGGRAPTWPPVADAHPALVAALVAVVRVVRRLEDPERVAVLAARGADGALRLAVGLSPGLYRSEVEEGALYVTADPEGGARGGCRVRRGAGWWVGPERRGASSGAERLRRADEAILAALEAAVLGAR